MSLFLAYKTDGDFSEIGFSSIIFDFFSRHTRIQAQGLIEVISLIIAIFSIYGLIKFFRKILEQRIVGLATAMIGFVGTFSILLTLYAE